MKKRIWMTLFMVMIMIFQAASPISAASVRSKKIVSIVYDDSTSMFTGGELKWAYANYAMQAFAGMLNKEDVLMINYMSSVDNGNRSPVIVDTNNRNRAAADIRTHISANSTPAEAIDSAFDNLMARANNAPDTQHWLVIMTDGQFNGTQIDQIETKLCTYADTKMPNGTTPKIVYFSMCDTAGEFTPKANLRPNIDVKSAGQADEIAHQISAIADLISGRINVADQEIKVIDEKQIKVTSDIPLINIGVLSQFSFAQVEQVLLEDGTPLQVESNVNIQYPEAEDRETDTDLMGNVALIGNSANNIPAGTYTIVFSEPIDKENIDIMIEPAIELRLMLYLDGKEVQDPTNLQIDSVIDAKAALYEIGTDNQIDLALLPGNVDCSIKCLEDGSEALQAQQLSLSGITLKDAKTRITADLTLPGYFSLNDFVEFEPLQLTVDAVIAEVFWDGSPRKQFKNKETGKMETDPENAVYISELDTNKTGIKFTVMIDGEPINKELAELMLPKFKKSVTTKIDPIGIEIMDDGSFLVYPSEKGLLYPSVFYWLKHHGDQEISVDIDGNQASGTLLLKDPDIWDIWPWIVIIYLIYWIFFKPRFYKSRYVEVFTGSMQRHRPVYSDGPVGAGRLSALSFKAWFPLIPWAQTKTIGGIVFRATGSLLLPRNRVEICHMKGKIADTSSNPSGVPLTRDRIAFGGNMYIKDGALYYHIKEI